MIGRGGLASALGLLLLAPLAALGAQKGASITLRARWQGTPYLLEAAEFLVRARAAGRAASRAAPRALARRAALGARTAGPPSRRR
jgi:hypothetical protein